MDSKNVRQVAIGRICRVVTAHPISTTTPDFLHIGRIGATRYSSRCDALMQIKPGARRIGQSCSVLAIIAAARATFRFPVRD
jgi:hypothetical protein